MPDSAPADSGQVNSRRQSQVCAAIVTYNIGEAIHPCLDAVRDQVGHVVIVDNGSDELTRRELHKVEASDSVTLILNDRNEGIAHAFNQAVQWAQGKTFRWILTLDHDSEATPGMVDKLVDAFATLEKRGIQNVGVVGANPFDVNHQHYLLYGPGAEDEPPLEEEIEVISSGSLLPLHIFDKVGLFNEDLFIYYVDTDFCRRITRSGFRVFVCLRAKLLHKEGCKTLHRFLWRHAYYDHYSKAARYYLMRNAIYILKKHSFRLSDIQWMGRRLCRDHLKILIFDDERFATLWFSLRGLIDGLRGKVGPMATPSEEK